MSEPLWAAIVGWIILIFGGGIAWGKHQTQLNALQKRSDNCDSVTVMTEDKCQKFHSLAQESMNIKLANIEKMLDEMKRDKDKVELRLGSMTAKMEVFIDRWNREKKDGQ